MTAAILVKPDSYAIGPSLHDWEYEEWSRRADARDTALESFGADWKSDLVSDLRCKAFTKIDETMADVMEAIGSDTEKTEQFNRLVFVLWHDPHNAEKARQLSQMMDAEINKLIEKDFQKNHH